MLKFWMSLVLVLGFNAAINAADKDAPKSGENQPTEQTGSISGTLSSPGKEAPNGCTAQLAVGGTGKGDETYYYLFGDGSIGKKLKELAQKGASVTVSGVVTKEGYRVTSIDKK